jgi:outer membrane lipoprotein-sorting protein
VLLKGIEQRYNHAKTLQVQYNETYTVQGQARKSETGTLTLRKPGRMRWDYSAPAGKLFLSDGKDVYLYTPDSHRVEKEPLKASDDMRAPMAFLLGKLDFSKEAGRHGLRGDGQGQERQVAVRKSGDAGNARVRDPALGGERPGRLHSDVPVRSREIESDGERRTV